MKCKQPCPRFEFWSPRPLTMMRTITPQLLPDYIQSNMFGSSLLVSQKFYLSINCCRNLQRVISWAKLETFQTPLPCFCKMNLIYNLYSMKWRGYFLQSTILSSDISVYLIAVYTCFEGQLTLVHFSWELANCFWDIIVRI